MSATKPKPRKPAPRKASGPTLAQRVADLEEALDVIVAGRMDGQSRMLHVQCKRLDAIEAEIFPAKHHPISSIRAIAARVAMLETRSRYRDASHDEPVSNGSEAIGHFTLTEPERPWWRRFLDHMGAP